MDPDGRLLKAAIPATAVLSLAAAFWLRPDAAALDFPFLIALGVLGLGAALLRPRGIPTLAVGAVVLPAAIESSSVLTAALLAAAIFVCREVIVWLVAPDSEGPASILRTLGPVLLAVLAAGAAWNLSAVGAVAAADRVSGRFGLWEVAAVAIYVLLLGGLQWFAAAVAEDVSTGVLYFRLAGGPLSLGPLALDSVGWLLGLVVTTVLVEIGRGTGLLLLAGIAALALLAARATLLARREREKAERLRELHLAGNRIIFRKSDLPAVARQIHAECRRVIPFSWFHFELLSTEQSWFAGPEGVVQEGRPEVPRSPPPLPGIHKRAAWQLLSRELSGEGGRAFGRLRLWCDPRALESGSAEWLDTLVPQIASSIDRALLDREARRDPLTGLPDRRVLKARLEDAFADCLEEGRPMAVVMLDLDHFKRVNDQYGHAVGDQVLVEVARRLEQHGRDKDLCCRYGGEEFAIVLEDTDGETALGVAERIRQAIEAEAFRLPAAELSIRISAGVASHPDLHVKKPAELVEFADKALYEAKRRGRNQCLLNIGRGSYQNVAGETLDTQAVQLELEPPTFFA